MVRIVIGKQISMAVLKVSALMEPLDGMFGPTKIPRCVSVRVDGSSDRDGAARARDFSAYAEGLIERHCLSRASIFSPLKTDSRKRNVKYLATT